MLSEIIGGEFVKKKWGQERWIINDAECGLCFKEMVLYPGHQVSLHRHKKSEVFLVIDGMMMVEIEADVAVGDWLDGSWRMDYPRSPEQCESTEPTITEMRILKVGEQISIRSNQWHRMRSIGAETCEFLEISTFHDDEDTERHPLERSR